MGKPIFLLDDDRDPEQLLQTVVRVTDGRWHPLFNLDKSLASRILEFRKTHPDISDKIFDQELNFTLTEMLFRMDRESHGIA